jgi:hypothetical protein
VTAFQGLRIFTGLLPFFAWCHLMPEGMQDTLLAHIQQQQQQQQGGEAEAEAAPGQTAAAAGAAGGGW